MKNFLYVSLILSLTLIVSGCSKQEETSQLESNDISDFSENISEDKLLGEWISTEEDWPIDIKITKISSDDTFKLEILDEDADIAVLSKDKSSKTTWVFINEKNTLEYRFTIYEKKLTMGIFFTSNKKEPNAIRPWILQKI